MRARVIFCSLAAAVAVAPAGAVDLGYHAPLSSGGYGMAPHSGPSVTAESVDGSLRLRASLGATYLEGNEFVYAGDYRVSKLIWQTTAPLLRGSVSADLGHGISISAEGSIAMGGDSHMVDYDWLGGDDLVRRTPYVAETGG